MGKTLYPVPEDLVKAGNCPTPPTPTLGGGDPVEEKKLRTYNIDGASHFGDWTKWNPWRSPGTAGKGNPKFQPCGVNSGSNPSFPDPPAAGQPQFANGTDLPPIPRDQWATWKIGSVVEAEWSIYAYVPLVRWNCTYHMLAFAPFFSCCRLSTHTLLSFHATFRRSFIVDTPSSPVPLDSVIMVEDIPIVSARWETTARPPPRNAFSVHLSILQQTRRRFDTTTIREESRFLSTRPRRTSVHIRRTRNGEKTPFRCAIAILAYFAGTKRLANPPLSKRT